MSDNKNCKTADYEEALARWAAEDQNNRAMLVITLGESGEARVAYAGSRANLVGMVLVAMMSNNAFRYLVTKAIKMGIGMLGKRYEEEAKSQEDINKDNTDGHDPDKEE